MPRQPRLDAPETLHHVMVRDLERRVIFKHLNPLRAQVLVDLRHLDRYPWTGHSALLGTVARPWLVSVSEEIRQIELRPGLPSRIADVERWLSSKGNAPSHVYCAPGNKLNL